MGRLDSFGGSLMHYMLHSSIVRKNASKTKVHIVFDASSKCTNEVSLNNCLIPGPNLNPSILNLILCFRQFKHIFPYNIEKAFHQIETSEINRDVL